MTRLYADRDYVRSKGGVVACQIKALQKEMRLSDSEADRNRIRDEIETLTLELNRQARVHRTALLAKELGLDLGTVTERVEYYLARGVSEDKAFRAAQVSLPRIE